MNRKVELSARIVLTAIALILATFALSVAYILNDPNGTSALLPTKVSTLSGEQMLLRFRSEYGFCKDPELQKAADTLLKTVVPQESDFEYQALISTTGAISQTALSLPGGYILIGADYVSRMASPHELAAILAHEIGHVELKHAEKHFLQNIRYRRVAFHLLDLIVSYNDAVSNIADGVVSALMFKKRDLNLELDADFYALSLMRPAGYDAKYLLSALEILSSNVPDRHRLESADRLARLSKHINDLEASDVSTVTANQETMDGHEWESVRKRCTGLVLSSMDLQ